MITKEVLPNDLFGIGIFLTVLELNSDRKILSNVGLPFPYLEINSMKNDIHSKN